MKNLIKEHIEYLKDNPEGYWFKRKLYGYGWTPATKEGWVVTLGAIAVIVGNAVRFERGGYADGDVVLQMLAPTFLAVAVLLYFCFTKGEKPKWQWGSDIAEDKD